MCCPKYIFYNTSAGSQSKTTVLNMVWRTCVAQSIRVETPARVLFEINSCALLLLPFLSLSGHGCRLVWFMCSILILTFETVFDLDFESCFLNSNLILSFASDFDVVWTLKAWKIEIQRLKIKITIFFLLLWLQFLHHTGCRDRGIRDTGYRSTRYEHTTRRNDTRYRDTRYKIWTHEETQGNFNTPNGGFSLN